jgi:hypothetical protein
MHPSAPARARRLQGARQGSHCHVRRSWRVAPRTAPLPGAAAPGSGAAPSAAPAPAPPQQQQQQQQQRPAPSGIDWEAKRRRRLVEDLSAAARKAGAPHGEAAIAAGVDTLESLIPGFRIDLERLKASDWVSGPGSGSALARRGRAAPASLRLAGRSFGVGRVCPGCVVSHPASWQANKQAS